MARSGRRKTKWVDTQVTEFGIVGGPLINHQIILSEGVIEFSGGGEVTLTRVVGTISMKASAGAPIVDMGLWVAPAYTGLTLPGVLTEDFFQRSRMMATIFRWVDLADDTLHIEVDVRTQRKLGQGVQLLLSIENQSGAGNDAVFAFHLRSLLLLP